YGRTIAAFIRLAMIRIMLKRLVAPRHESKLCGWALKGIRQIQIPCAGKERNRLRRSAPQPAFARARGTFVPRTAEGPTVLSLAMVYRSFPRITVDTLLFTWLMKVASIYKGERISASLNLATGLMS